MTTDHAPRSRVGARAARRAQAAEALELHAGGLSLLGIARRLGITPAQAERRLADAIATLPAQDVVSLRATSELRLDRAAETFAELAKDPDPRIRLQATNGLVGVERDRARLLGTYQKPPKEED